ncbi:MAG TPA: hypothetical protein PLP07_02230 [Pyrinomonadaceae bacterium]|nr:hypothetical protein [Chloracidobacterium sp.]MBL0242273.1 hypothetical protein [Chloracidobacterium sp.]HQX54718.1 hypothetical protein [Pyrinomonadaceae bacterium]HQY66954.1 hypothetical protein [Pyrinomonadaceae bacterium]HRA40672.1 hypothetical protein [Pyrinomonadaceae bacterium]
MWLVSQVPALIVYWLQAALVKKSGGIEIRFTHCGPIWGSPLGQEACVCNDLEPKSGPQMRSKWATLMPKRAVLGQFMAILGGKIGQNEPEMSIMKRFGPKNAAFLMIFDTDLSDFYRKMSPINHSERRFGRVRST